jgi:hypothetical protein
VIQLKVGQFFFLGCVYAIGFYVFGVDIVYTQPNWQLWEHNDSGIIIEYNGLLIRIGEYWVGIAKIHEAVFDVPIATWLVICFLLGGLWSLFFDWK